MFDIGKRRLSAIVVIAIAAVTLPAATASGTGVGTLAQQDSQLLAKAQPDECWGGIGVYQPGGDGSNCAQGFQPKVNQGYVWGLAEGAGAVWFGTVANMPCLGLGMAAAGAMGLPIDLAIPYRAKSWTCEYAKSPYAIASGGSYPNAFGDVRPPGLYRYVSGAPVDLVKAAGNAELTDLVAETEGIRAVVVHPQLDLVLFAGPNVGETRLNLFAFAKSDGHYLASTSLSDYSDIRKWIQLGGDLYTGVRVPGATPTGAVLRWEPSSGDLFHFVPVGRTNTEVAELAYYRGRIFATTWGSLVTTGGGSTSIESGLWMSPPLKSGLTDTPWQQIWKASDYEPDAITAQTYIGGALAVYDGKLYWGTMHEPLIAALGHLLAGESTTDVVKAVVATYRATALFRLSIAGEARPKIQLLYGEEKLPAFVNGSWQLVPNRLHLKPTYGHSGFGNPFNNYTWSMAVSDGKLYVGTMDYSYLASEVWTIFAYALGLPPDLPNPLPAKASGFGADLLVIPSGDLPGQIVDRTGLGNPLNYGIRNLLPTAGGTYVGTANPMNLATAPGAPQGGWELRFLPY